MWKAKDKDATEVEVTEFVASLVRLTKPRVIVETGTYQGQTTLAMLQAIYRNQDKFAAIWTYEIDPIRATRFAETLDSVAAESIYIIASAINADNCPMDIDLAFLDSGMRTRQDDIDVVWPRVRPGGIVLIHDASPDRPPGKVRPRAKPDTYTMFDIATPRGLIVFQKARRS